jgi:hypothetical protein
MRKHFQQRVATTRLLRFGDDWGCKNSSFAYDYPPGAVDGCLVGGEFYSAAKENTDMMDCVWSLMRKNPKAMGSWGHDKILDTYIKKMVVHLEGEHCPMSLPSLQGIAEKDPGRRKGGPTLTDERRKTVLVISNTHKTHLAGDPKPKKAREERGNLRRTSHHARLRGEDA